MDGGGGWRGEREKGKGERGGIGGVFWAFVFGASSEEISEASENFSLSPSQGNQQMVKNLSLPLSPFPFRLSPPPITSLAFSPFPDLP
jgi:hypothetical protein